MPLPLCGRLNPRPRFLHPARSAPIVALLPYQRFRQLLFNGIAGSTSTISARTLRPPPFPLARAGVHPATGSSAPRVVCSIGGYTTRRRAFYSISIVRLVGGRRTARRQPALRACRAFRCHIAAQSQPRNSLNGCRVDNQNVRLLSRRPIDSLTLPA
jgi:hypothetical protein